MGEVTQADRVAAADLYDDQLGDVWFVKRLRDGDQDKGAWVQAFAAHRIASTPSNADLVAALEGAIKIIDEIDEYQKKPERGDYGVECACCMGELLDEHDRATISKIRAAIAKARA